MAKENLDQDLGWAPKRYQTYSAFERGEFRVVHDAGAPVAVVWKNAGTGTGIKWITQSDVVMQMQRMFHAGAAGDIPATVTYGAVESKYAPNLGETQTGTLDQVEELLNSFDED